MASIQEKLSVLANTVEKPEGLSTDRLLEEKKQISVVDYKMVSFSLSGKDYAIDIMKVKEIAKAGHFTYVPNALPFVLGVHNLRGEIIAIIDLRLFFNIEIPERTDDQLDNLLIVTIGEQTFGVVVDKIDKVVGIQKSAIQPPHPLFGDINIKYISGVVESENNLYVLLDIDRIFGVKSPEEEKKLAETTKAQVKMAEENVPRQIQQIESSEIVPVEKKQTDQLPPSRQGNDNDDLKFIADSLKNFKKFYICDITRDWAKKRYEQWKVDRGEGKTQIQNETDASMFISPFFSRYTGTWWGEDYADAVSAVLPVNTAKNIIVWNPGCGKGYESYSLACILKKKYPSSKVKIYGHDVDLLSVSNAPLMNLTDDASNSWYQPYTVRTVSGDYTFNKEIKDSIMFEYHDCMNTNNLPPIDIFFARDLLAFLPEGSQTTVLSQVTEKIKGNGVIIVGDNENIAIPGWTKKSAGIVSVYSK